MYREEERTAVRGQLRRRRAAVWVPAALLLALLLTALCLRIAGAPGVSIRDDAGMARLRALENVCYISGALCAVWLIFAYGMLLDPLRCYERHLTDMLDGIRHETEGTWAGVSDDISEINGVRYRAVSVTQTDEKGWPYDRRFYLDCEKQPPEIPAGQPVRVTYHDKQIIDIAIA